MDITSVQAYRVARSREDLQLASGEAYLAGGTWIMSEPQPATTGLVDLTGLAWPDLEETPEGLRVAATCTVANLVAWAATAPAHWPAAQLVPAAANALLASFKIWNTATVGGNICRAFAAGAMVSLSVALDAVAVIWTADDERRMPVAELVTGNGTTILGRDDVLRAVEIPAHALASRALLRKIALAEHGRSGAVVTGRVDPDGTSVFTVTAATATPTVLRFAQLPTETDLADAVASAPGYYTDPLGAADWRRAVSIELASRIRAELA